ncbi:MFS transporter [Frankia sp. ACN1ag]|uniref:MFS transporter n=2 Tax=unclassified Frankia TaxID=2632575 RepID=UPI001F2CDBA2|nr:MFS transporter [Frankia sp. ACN1ag]
MTVIISNLAATDTSCSGGSVRDRKWWALGGIALAVFAVGLDGTVLAVALPTLAPALHASATDLVWFSSAYLLALAAAMLPIGVLGDRYGRRRVMLASLAVFGAASIYSAESTSAAVFIAARALGGVAGAGVIVMALSAVTVLFTERERPRAVGIWAGVNFLALPAGPLLGGWLLTRFWWGWVFWINVPVVVLSLVVGVVLVPESRAPHRPRIDWVGIVGFSSGLVALVYGFVDAGSNGWISISALGPMAAGVVLLVGFVRYEQRRAAQPGGEPLVDATLFRSRAFTWGIALAAVSSLAMIGVLFAMPQYFQAVVGTDAIGSGLRLLPLIGGLVLGAPVAEPAARALGGRRVLSAGFVVLAAGLLLGSFTSVDTGGAFIAGWMAVTGLGLGLTLSTAASAALAQLPPERSGVASALMQALQEVGGPLGSAILGSVSLAAYRAHLQLTGLPPELAEKARGGVFDGTEAARRVRSDELLHNVHSAFAHGLSDALLVSAGIAAVGGLIAALLFPGAEAGGTKETVRRPDIDTAADAHAS